MKGSSVGGLYVYVLPRYQTALGAARWSRFGAQGDRWILGSVTLVNTSPYSVNTFMFYVILN